MKKIQKHAVGIDQGETALFADFADGGEMWTGDGSRQRHRDVRFSEPFLLPPSVHVSMSLWDMDSATNARADVAAEKITEKGFRVIFRTWGDTRVARVRVRWMAIGEVTYEDDWLLY
jgi:hypothetical protein